MQAEQYNLVTNFLNRIEDISENRRNENGTIIGYQACLDEINFLARQCNEIVRAMY